MHEARALAERSGALVSVAVMDLALAELGLGAFDRELCLRSARRCVDASRRYGLATLPVAHLWLAGGYALAGDARAMEQAGEAALRPDPDDPRILGDLWGRVRATLSIVRDDLDQLRRDLDAMMTYARVAPTTTSFFPTRIFWALLHTIDDDDHGAAARDELAAATHLRVWRASLPVSQDRRTPPEQPVRPYREAQPPGPGRAAGGVTRVGATTKLPGYRRRPI